MAVPSNITQPDQVEELFPDAFEARLTHELQQGTSKLGATVDNGGIFIGDSMFSPMIGAAVAQDLVRFQEIVLGAADHRMVEVKCTPKIAALPVADVDKNKLNVALAPAYAESCKMAINRELDKVIYGALRAEANRAGTLIPTLGTYNTDLNWELLLQAAAMLEDVEALEGAGPCTLVLPAIPKAVLAGQMAVALKTAHEAGISASKLRYLDPVDHVTFVTYGGCSRITAAPAGHAALGSGVIGTDLFMYVKSAVVARANDNPKPVNERLATIMADMLGTWCQTGAVVKLPLGVVRIRCRRNSEVKITPLPIEAVA